MSLLPKKREKIIRPGIAKTVVLKPEIPGSNIGITLAGGIDYETKEITVCNQRKHESYNAEIFSQDSGFFRFTKCAAGASPVKTVSCKRVTGSFPLTVKA